MRSSQNGGISPAHLSANDWFQPPVRVPTPDIMRVLNNGRNQDLTQAGLQMPEGGVLVGPMSKDYLTLMDTIIYVVITIK